MLSNISFCTLCASTLWVHNSTHSLVLLMSSIEDISPITSLIMPSLSSLCMNCSVSFLSSLSPELFLQTNVCITFRVGVLGSLPCIHLLNCVNKYMHHLWVVVVGGVLLIHLSPSELCLQTNMYDLFAVLAVEEAYSELCLHTNI